MNPPTLAGTDSLLTPTEAREAAEYAMALCARIACCTDVPGTITRLFLSPATREVHALLTAAMHRLGMTVRTDCIGNLRGIYHAAPPQTPQRPQRQPQSDRGPLATNGATTEANALPTLVLGSHIDTVPNAGRYDGVLGGVLPLALIRALGGRRLPYNIELIAFSEEEGIRFKLPFLGSRAFAGTLTLVDLLREDEHGVSIAEAVHAFGLRPDTLGDCAPTPGTFAFVEVHIEQGPVLESLGLPLGAVTEIVGQTRSEFTFFGQANHAGTTPMHMRQDALVAAAELVVAIEEFAQGNPPLVATVGTLKVAPGATNVIPGMTTLQVDLRHPNDAVRQAATVHLEQHADGLAAKRNLRCESHRRSEQASVTMHPVLLQTLLQSLAQGHHPIHRMHSGAGHDAMIVAGILPAAMLFLRTPNGLSHHPDEQVLLPDVQAAIETCFRFLQNLNPAAFAGQGHP